MVVRALEETRLLSKYRKNQLETASSYLSVNIQKCEMNNLQVNEDEFLMKLMKLIPGKRTKITLDWIKLTINHFNTSRNVLLQKMVLKKFRILI